MTPAPLENCTPPTFPYYLNLNTNLLIEHRTSNRDGQWLSLNAKYKLKHFINLALF